MARHLSLRDANQRFAQCIREVESGEEIVITRRGQPVARMVPVRRVLRALTPEQEAALARMRALAGEGWTLGDQRFDRDEAHER